MTFSNQAIRQELERAEEALAAAKLLLGPFNRDALSRVYYAVFHTVRALLMAVGVSPKTHQGLVQKFHEHYIATGKLEVHWAKKLSRFQDDRSLADYDVGFQPEEDQVSARCSEAQTLIETARSLLQSHLVDNHG